ncbi:pyruvate formate lyase activating enzyme [Clostridium cadaveris]|uniref:Glycyl-radical enzyme activating protein n=1 Tax=Clostridium cadaveris TaxID=1529 RepID=A0A1I2L9C3_9CLOT|nr:trans-4-hydroxy-L-proline dehydratase activase [Clostridium cadaveris]MDM8311331.1 glycyl-radical enzyme activating protein [Clostridium cadaveris]MDU4951714.1 glycyl-radical enzyme activating protein [Clostridium sp.]PWL52408.1 MAG: glycyl-radical enzyme activating protein [Clostridium cadaveris]SFF75059.1 pyruvate formate lyase activating enzyme [Clostridium cadaveris]
MRGSIFNIQRYSIHDGPGIRTTIFFKGCPLKCQWCHNPESQRQEKEIMIYTNKCIDCGFCAKACKSGALTFEEGMIHFNKILCKNCGECCEVCPTGARTIVGEYKNSETLLKEIEKDKVFYDESDGGVTFSGGEPLSQEKFLEEILKRCKEAGIHTTVDTSGYGSENTIRSITPYVDLFLYDLKSMNDFVHKKYTGVSNKRILENLKLIGELGGKIFIRIPLITGINDSKEDIYSFIKFIKNIDGILQVNILPYHNISQEKYLRLRREYQCENVKEPTSEGLEEIKSMFENEGFKTVIGG